MKISVITYHRVYNYGAALQAYATEKALNNLGYEAELVDYIPKKVKNYGSVAQVFYESGLFSDNLVKRILSTIVKTPSYRKQRSVFDGFIDKRITMTKPYYSEEELKSDIPQADVYFTGSDQVWNNTYVKEFDGVYFLSYAENKPKIALSASFGRKDFTKDELGWMMPWLKKYTAISVREKSGLELLKDADIPLKEHTLDPTLILRKEEWEKLISDVKHEDYILVYQLHGSSKAEDYAVKIGNEKKLKVLRIVTMLHQKSGKSNPVVLPEVEEFLSLIYHAKYVVTDSFHGTAFSLNFNKNFIVCPPGKTGERIQSVLELTNLTERIATSEEDAVSLSDKTIDFTKCNQVFDEERDKAKRYVENALNLCKGEY